MSNATESKSSIYAIDKCLNLPVNEWPPALMSVLASRLEDATYNEHRGEIQDLHGQLEALFNHAWLNVPQEVRDAVTRNKDNAALRMAYTLGALSFAQQYAATVMVSKPEDAFYEAFKDAKTLKILQQIASAPSVRAEIEKVQGLLGTMVSQKMKQLLELGIVDFRMRYAVDQPSGAEYFLTPAAEAVMQRQKEQG